MMQLLRVEAGVSLITDRRQGVCQTTAKVGTCNGFKHHLQCRRSISKAPRLAVYAQKQTEEDKQPPTPSTPPSKDSSNGSRVPSTSSVDVEEELEVAFRVFDWSKYTERWDVPWNLVDTTGGMAAWAGSFVLVGVSFLPIASAIAGPGGFAALSQQDKAVLALANQIVETTVGLGIIWLIVRRYDPLPPNLFKYSFKNPFRKPDGWMAWGIMGILLSPFIVYCAGALVQMFGPEDLSGRGTADAVSQILSLDEVTFASLFATTAILAPLLEESLFRGFLLTSLTRYMPVPLAVLFSSLAFGLAHLSPKDFPQLTALGILLGFVYVRSRNLLAPMMIHGAWNGTVLSVLYALKASGVDLDKLLHGGQF